MYNKNILRKEAFSSISYLYCYVKATGYRLHGYIVIMIVISFNEISSNHRRWAKMKMVVCHRC